jgi:hypothetical protein
LLRSKYHRCYACDLSYDVYVQNGRRPNWYLNRDKDNNALCSRCHQTIIKNPRRFKTRAELYEFRRQNQLGKSPGNKGWRLEYDRHCYACGSSTTMVDKTGRRHWMLNHDPDNNVLCNKCKMRYFWNPRRKPQIWLTWRDKQIHMEYNPRTGFCSKCGKIGQTHLHHTNYDSNNPLDNTIELCVSCHSKQSWKILIEKRAQELFTKWKQKQSKVF